MLLCLCAMPAAMASCLTETLSDKDTAAPGQIKDVTFKPMNGGGCLRYTIPADPDFLYVRAEYELDNGMVISRTSSIYCDSLLINGMGTVKEYAVKMYSVDRDSNESEPLIIKVTPLEPTVKALYGNLKIFAGFSSVVVTMDNPQGEPVDVYVKLKASDGTEALKVYSTNQEKERIFIQGLNPIEYQVSAYIVDHYGNSTEEKAFGALTPKTDYELEKGTWSFLRDQLLYGNHWDYSNPQWEKQTPFPEWMATYKQDSLKNAKETNFEGDVKKFFDGQVDEDASQSLNYFHSGTNYPFSYFFDLGRTVRISRMRLWQRNSYAWSKYSVKTCEIYVSNDPDPKDGILDDWTYVGTYSLNIPSSEIEKKKQILEGTESWIYPDNPDFTRPFRYLRYKAVKDFSNGTIGSMSEITLYGENVD